MGVANYPAGFFNQSIELLFDKFTAVERVENENLIGAGDQVPVLDIAVAVVNGGLDNVKKRRPDARRRRLRGASLAGKHIRFFESITGDVFDKTVWILLNNTRRVVSILSDQGHDLPVRQIVSREPGHAFVVFLMFDPLRMKRHGNIQRHAWYGGKALWVFGYNPVKIIAAELRDFNCTGHSDTLHLRVGCDVVRNALDVVVRVILESKRRELLPVFFMNAEFAIEDDPVVLSQPAEFASKGCF